MYLLYLGLYGGIRRQPPQAPPRHGPGLRERVDHDELPAKLGVPHGQALVALVVGKAVIDVVADDVDARARGDLGHRVERLGGVDAARGVVGRGEHEGLRARADRGHERIARDLEACLARVERHDPAVSHADERLVEAKGWHGHHDLVARVEECQKRRRERLGGADGHDELVGRVREPLLGHVGRERLEELGSAVVGRVVRETARERLPHRRANRRGCVELGLTQRELDAAGRLVSERREAADAARGKPREV